MTDPCTIHKCTICNRYLETRAALADAQREIAELRAQRDRLVATLLAEAGDGGGARAAG